MSNKRFFFDRNHFDAGHEDEETDETLPPPPPTFSEEELEAARKDGYSEGYAKAQADEKGGREQAMTTTLSRIAKDIAPFFEAEAAREKRYEQEAVHLALVIFRTLYPHYNETLGFEELKKTLSDLLVRKRTAKSVHVFVATDMVEGINAHLSTLSEQNAELYFEISADPALEGASCRLSWAEGGALFEPEKIAAETLEILQQTLAQDGFTGHDIDASHGETPSTGAVDESDNGTQSLTPDQKDDIVETDVEGPAPADENVPPSSPDDGETR